MRVSKQGAYIIGNPIRQTAVYMNQRNWDKCSNVEVFFMEKQKKLTANSSVTNWLLRLKWTKEVENTTGAKGIQNAYAMEKTVIYALLHAELNFTDKVHSGTKEKNHKLAQNSW